MNFQGGNREALVTALRSLRKGRGLTEHRLKQLGLPADLEASVRGLGNSIQARALQAAYGVGMSDPGNLTTRRNTFAVFEERHADTVEAYENEMIEELATRLMGQPSAFEVLVVGNVEQGRLTATMVSRHVEGERIDMVITEAKQSPQCLVYQLPKEWSPTEVMLMAYFTGQPYPKTAWWTRAESNVLDLITANQDYGEANVLPSEDGMTAAYNCDDPLSGHYFGLFWD